MKISTRLTLAAFVPLFMLLVVGGALFFSYRSLNSAQDDSQTSRQIASSSSDLNGFVYSYVLHHEDRPKQQFLAAHDSITALVSGAHFSNGDQQRLLDTIRTDNDTIGTSFSALVSSYESAGLTNGSALAQQAQEQLTGQILLTSQEVHSDALRLQTLTDNNLNSSQTRIIVLILVVMAITAVPLTIVLFQMRRSIGDSLSGLRRGVEVIGAGDLDHRIAMTQRNELGELARSFDEMTGRLQTVTVSRDALEQEVEERKQADKALRRSEEKFSSLYISMVEGVALHEIVCDGSGRAIDYVITDVNPSFESITGLPRDQAVGKKASAAYGTGEAPFLDIYARVASSGKPESFETYFPPMEKHFSIMAFSPTKDTFATVFQDITQRKLADDELRAALAAKDDFLSMVSHEMRTPLTGIMGNALLLSEPSFQVDETEGREMLRDIAEGAKRLAGTIDNMLALARLEAGRRTVIEPLSAQAVVAEIAEQHRLRYGHRKIELRVAHESLKVLASREYLVHILSNLLENAEKYTSKDEPVEIELSVDGNEATVRVVDRGIGLTPEEAEHIFEPFYRSARIAAISPGMGIGLSVCKRLVEEQRGRIWAESDGEGKGADFVFTLPIAGASAPSGAESSPSEA